MRSRRLWFVVSPCLVAALAVPARARAASGGPDAGGWRWADSGEPKVDTTVETPATWTTIAAPLPDEGVFPVALSFPFRLHDVTSSTVYLSSNGWISLQPATAAEPVNRGIPDPAAPNAVIAFFWDDLGGSPVSWARHGVNGACDLIEVYQWHAPSGTFIRIYIQFYRNGSLKVVYQVSPDVGSATVGIENGAGTAGTQIVRDGNTAPGVRFAADYAILFHNFPSPDCSAPDSVACPGSLAGTTLGGAGNATAYACGSSAYSGAETAFRFTQRVPGAFQATLADLGTRDQDLFLLGGSCDATLGCLAGGGDAIDMPMLAPGTYHLVVDGKTPADDGPFTLSTTRSDLDCNRNGSPDGCDVAGGGSQDCNRNQIPDECDVASSRWDCNRNRIPDGCDIAGGTSADCNDDGRPDECPGCPVDVVFVMDTSGSMAPVAGELCAAIDQTIAVLTSEGIDFRAYLWGINGTDWCLTDSVIAQLGDAVPGPPPPAPNLARLTHQEDWALATAVVAGRFPWDRSVNRIVVPMGDEGPFQGDPVFDPGDDRDAITQAISVAVANDVLVSPISPRISAPEVVRLAQDLAAGTGGQWWSSDSVGGGLADAILDIVRRACASTGGTAAAGPDRRICSGDTITLDGSSSTKTCTGDRQFRWLEGTSEVCGSWSLTPTCDVTPVATAIYTLEVRCPEAPVCAATDSVLVQLDGGAAPGSLGNTLRAVRRVDGVYLSCASVPEAATYNLYRGVVKGVWTPALITGLFGATVTLPDVPGPPSLYFYNFTGTSCAGIEGP